MNTFEENKRHPCDHGQTDQEWEASVHHYSQALQHNPRSPEALVGLGRGLLKLGKMDEGLAVLSTAIAIQPGHIDALLLLGHGLLDQGRGEDALQFFLRVLDLESDHVIALQGMGQTFLRLGQLQQAKTYLSQALQLAPNHPEILILLGEVLHRLGMWDQAQELLRQAAKNHPDPCAAHNTLGCVLLEQGHFAAAEEQLQHALAIHPQDCGIINNLGVAWMRQGHVSAALDQFRHALNLKPDYHEAANNMGLAYQELGLLDDALNAFRQAQHLKPDFADPYFNEGVIELTKGNFAQGWRGFAWRLRMEKYRNHRHLHTATDLTTLAGRTVLVVCELGFGDTIQFIRYARLLQRHAAQVIVVCPEPLVRLLTHAPGVTQCLCDSSPPPPCDTHVFLLSLPHLFGHSIPDFPATIPYLTAHPQRINFFRQSLKQHPGYRIGIVWRGNPQHLQDRHRSMTAMQFSQLLNVAGITLVNLQKEASQEEITLLSAKGKNRWVDFRSELHDFADTAAAIMALDLVITVDTAVAHLAGALGQPVWVLLPAVADWRWLLERPDSPWYPTMRLFRQTSLGDWPTVLTHVLEQLPRLLANTPQPD
ncbi:MAG: tetratricopeptide repeat protein [Magnetococcales bacterium]|nr:tetratricopeptide repeat protein [Magnetococcales bacterium]